MSRPLNPALSGDCPLAQTRVYEEFLSISPIEALPGSHSLVIRSRLDSARDAKAFQVRYQTVLDQPAIERLHAWLGDYLARVSTPASSQPQEGQP